MQRQNGHAGVAPLVIVHSSDLHIDDEPRLNGYTGLIGLEAVLATAADVGADLVTLVGDTFDNGRVPSQIAKAAAGLLAKAPCPVVLLPGNHDPGFASDSMFHKSGIVDVPQARVLGITAPERLLLDDLGLEIAGRAHRSYDDMHPLPDQVPRQARWRLVLAHGHYVPPADWADEQHRSWLISDAALAGTAADYVALGHWDRPVAVGDGRVRAYYSGSPDLARTVNVIRFCDATGIAVERVPVHMPIGPR